MNNTYNVDDGHGTNLCGGITYDAAMRIAQDHADQTGLACLVWSSGSEIIVEPESPEKLRT